MVKNNEQTMNGVEDAVRESGRVGLSRMDRIWVYHLLGLSSSEIKQEQQGRESLDMCTQG